MSHTIQLWISCKCFIGFPSHNNITWSGDLSLEAYDLTWFIFVQINKKREIKSKQNRWVKEYKVDDGLLSSKPSQNLTKSMCRSMNAGERSGWDRIRQWTNGASALISGDPQLGQRSVHQREEISLTSEVCLGTLPCVWLLTGCFLPHVRSVDWDLLNGVWLQLLEHIT